MINDLNVAVEAVKMHKAQNLTVGLITGSFDILHIGHVRLLEFAKKNLDKVIVGVDDDFLVALYKDDKDFDPFVNRYEIVNALKNVDLVFKVDHRDFTFKDLEEFYLKLTEKLDVTHIACHPLADNYADEKRRRVNNLNITLLECWDLQLLS